MLILHDALYFKSYSACLSLFASSSAQTHMTCLESFSLKLHLRFMHSRKRSADTCHPAHSLHMHSILLTSLQCSRVYALVTDLDFSILVSVSIPMYDSLLALLYELLKD